MAERFNLFNQTAFLLRRPSTHDTLVSGSRRRVRAGIARDSAARRGAQIVNQSWLTMVSGYRLSSLWKQAVNRSASSIRALVTCADLAPNS